MERSSTTARAIRLTVALAVAAVVNVAAAGDRGAKAPIRIGIVNTIFQTARPEMLQPLVRPFRMLMEAQTGIDGDIVIGGEPMDLARDVEQGRLELGVLQGIEFAWAGQQYPDLRPLAIATYGRTYLGACLVVRDPGVVRGIGDLEGKTLALPAESRAHSQLFLEKLIRQAGHREPKGFLGKITRPIDAEDALDAVAEGTVDAAVVDCVALDRYRLLKPGRLHRLRVAAESERFPASVVMYRSGAVDMARLRRCRDGLIDAKRVPLGRQLLTLVKLNEFQPVPPDYIDVIAAILKSYPPPDRRQATLAPAGPTSRR